MNLKKGTLYFITRKFITKSCKENCGLAIFRISYFNHHLCKLCCISSRRNLSKIEIKKVNKILKNRQVDSRRFDLTPQFERESRIGFAVKKSN